MNRNQKGSALAAVLVVVGVLVALVGFIVMSYVSAHNTANAFEQQIKAVYSNNQNVLASYSQKVVEAAQVPTMMTDDIVRVTREAIGGRYGPDGSKAVFQMLREQNPQLDPQLYRKVQQLVESGRDEFKNSQTRLIDVKRSYETALGTFMQGKFMRMAGYPTINLDDYKIVVNDRTENAFKTGKESSPIQLRPSGPASTDK